MKSLLIGTVFAIATFLTTLQVTPRIIMAVAMDRVATNAISDIQAHPDIRFRDIVREREGINVLVSSLAPADHKLRSVVRPSNDMIYGACVYDLEKAHQGVLIESPKGRGYSSVSAFAANSDNFYVEDDRAISDGFRVHIVFDEGQPTPAGFTRVISPTRKGIALVRILIEEKHRTGEYVEQMSSSRCDPLVQ